VARGSGDDRAEIRDAHPGSAERVFQLLSDLRNYDRWLPGSAAFHGTIAISDGPIAIGTSHGNRDFH
jgi:hypothetical protein